MNVLHKLSAHNAQTARFKADVAVDELRRAASRLTSEQRLALAIWLVDHTDGLDPDARNEAVDVLGGLVS
jgi:dsDNA-binding SOS-regulon protein